MAKEWILNSVMNRFQLNFKRNVGATSESIRKCAPKSVEEWKEYYYTNDRNIEHIDELGRKLYTKISEVIPAEIEAITEDDCKKYMHNLVIDRTYDGYTTEIKTIYGQLQQELNIEIKPAPDEWDRLFNVDFFIPVGKYFIGLQIKPMSSPLQIPQIFKEGKIQKNSHEKFTEKYSGKVFYIFSVKVGSTKKIFNTEVVDEIKKEIQRLLNI